MKRSFFNTLALVALAVLTIACMIPADAPAQSSVIYVKLPISTSTATTTSSLDPGSTWQASQRLYSKPFSVAECDSVHLIFMFPDSVNMTAKLQYGWDDTFSSPLDSTSAVIDSVLGGATGIYQEYSCYTAMGGGPFGATARVVYDFKATKNHAPAYDATTKFKAWLKCFLRVK